MRLLSAAGGSARPPFSFRLRKENAPLERGKRNALLGVRPLQRLGASSKRDGDSAVSARGRKPHGLSLCLAGASLLLCHSRLKRRRGGLGRLRMGGSAYRAGRKAGAFRICGPMTAKPSARRGETMFNRRATARVLRKRGLCRKALRRGVSPAPFSSTLQSAFFFGRTKKNGGCTSSASGREPRAARRRVPAEIQCES